jgi:hypothetical protein
MKDCGHVSLLEPEAALYQKYPTPNVPKPTVGILQTFDLSLIPGTLHLSP